MQSVTEERLKGRLIWEGVTLTELSAKANLKIRTIYNLFNRSNQSRICRARVERAIGRGVWAPEEFAARSRVLETIGFDPLLVSKKHLQAACKEREIRVAGLRRRDLELELMKAVTTK